MKFLTFRDSSTALLSSRSFEFRESTQRNTVLGFVAAVSFHLLAIGIYNGQNYLSRGDDEAPTVRVRIMKYSELGPPPSLTNPATPAIAVSGPLIKPSVGIPVPVPDAEISIEQTLATQQELSQIPTPFSGEEGVGVDQNIVIDDEPAIDAFVPVEKLPIPIKKVIPTYPEIARRAGVEGTVWVKVLVDKEGKVKKAVMIRSDAEVFNEPATKAALEWKFTPAIMNSGPVSVWVALPFRFRLSDKPS